MSGKNPPVMRSNRRSARRRGQEQDPVVAPGFGTKADIERLTKDLSTGSDNALPVAAVEGATSSAWADFMKEEGVDLYGAGSSNASKNKASANSNKKDDEEATKKKKATTKKKSGKRKAYDFEKLEEMCSGPATKKAKTAKDAGGHLLQTGTLDVTVVGRKGISKEVPSYQLQVPTKILPGIGITRVFTSCNACHSIALDASGQAYGWGRNDQSQLTSSLPPNVALPTLLEGLSEYTIVAAAVGKQHTLVLTDEGKVLAVGFNKMGQCGLKSSVEVIKEFKECVFPPDVKIAQVACGEHFSVALTTQGQIYTTGSSEYGQLGNGETGEFFVTASKLAFANCNLFTLRNRFMERDPAQEASSSTNSKEKLVPIDEDIRIQAIACGKHHTIAVEATYDDEDDDDPPKLRVFSWGCGNYGVLGHGVQADEYFPREIAALGTSIWLPPGPITPSAGVSCTLLKTANGHVYYWGRHRSVGEAVMRPQLVEALANNRHVVTHCAAGAQTVIATTENGNTVAWGQGPHGELGLGTVKSSAKPVFVAAIDGCRLKDLACGYGHTLFVVTDEDAEDKKHIEKVAEIDEGAKEELEAVWASAPPPAPAGAKGKGRGKKRS